MNRLPSMVYNPEDCEYDKSCADEPDEYNAGNFADGLGRCLF